MSLIKAPKAVAKTFRGKRVLLARQPKVEEDTKELICVKGRKTSKYGVEALTDLVSMCKPHAKMLQRNNNDVHPMQDPTSIEFLCEKNTASLFICTTHNKKHPNALIFGRTFDHTMLDAIECEIIEPENSSHFATMKTLSSQRKATVRYAGKPAMIFEGDAWETNANMQLTMNLLLDMFKGEKMDKISASAIDRVIVCSCISPSSSPQDNSTVDRFSFRQYGILLHASTSALPRVELDEVGPRMDLRIHRVTRGSDDLRKASLKNVKVTKPKNIERTAMGDKVGRIHMKKQDLANVNVLRLKGLKRNRDEENDGNDAEASSSTRATKRVSGAGGYGPSKQHSN